MKKNFFKKLASVLSLALVVTSVAPMTSTTAAAATTPDIKTRYTTVYEGSSRTYAVKNATGYTVKWSVSGEGAEYAAITSKGKLTVDTDAAKAAKNAAVVVKAKFYKNSKLVSTRQDSVAIKVSATAVAITTAADVKAIPAGVATDFNRTLTPANSTSKTYWAVTDTVSGAAVTTASITADGVLTASVAGTYNVVATVKNSATSKVLATATQAVTVVNNVDKVSQKSLTKINVVFTNVVKDVVKAADFTVVNTDTKVKQAVKAVTFSEDGKTAIVELYSNLVNTKAYQVTYGTQTKEFTANAGAVTQILLTAGNVTYATTNALTITLLDANGIDVTSSTELAKVALTTTNGYITTDKKLILYSVGDKATVTATYHTYTYVDGKEVTYTVKADYVAVDAATTSIKSITAYTVATTTPSAFTTVSHVIAMGDTGYKVYAQGLNTAGTAVTTGFTYESTDKSVLLVASNGTLLPVKEGTVLVKVISNSVTVDTVVITVGAVRKAATITADKLTVTVSNSASVGDTQTIKATVLDQYGVAFNATDASFVAISPASTNPVVASLGTDKKTVSFSAPNTAAGTYQFNITDEGLTISVSVVVKAAATDIKTYAIELNATSFDAVYTTDTSNSAVQMKLFAYDTNGVKVKQVTDGAMTFVITRNGDSTFTSTKNISSAAATFDVLSTSAGVVTAATADVYTVKAVSGGAVYYTTQFTITDTQTAPTVTLTQNAVTLSSAVYATDAALTVNASRGTGSADDYIDCLTASTGTITSVDCMPLSTGILTSGSYDVLIKTATVAVTVDSTNNIVRNYTVTINQNVTLTK